MAIILHEASDSEEIYRVGGGVSIVAALSFFIMIGNTENSIKKVKLQSNKIVLILTILLILFGLFYWFELRPARIKHECSWVKRHVEAKPERIALTEEELREKGILRDCSREPSVNPSSTRLFQEVSCEAKNAIDIEKYSSSQEAQPAHDVWKKANEREYKFCLHNKGL